MEIDDSASGNLSQQQINATLISGSPPQSGRSSPPLPSTPSLMQGTDALDLQIDYWPTVKLSGDGKEKVQAKDKDQGKCSIKSQFRSLQVIY